MNDSSAVDNACAVWTPRASAAAAIHGRHLKGGNLTSMSWYLPAVDGQWGVRDVGTSADGPSPCRVPARNS